MKGYKGLENGLAWRGKQYTENTVFEEQYAEVCKKGMHFCDLPHGVFLYYSPGENHDFAEVEALDWIEEGGDRKLCCKKLRVCGKVSVFDLVKISVSAAFEKFDFNGKIEKAKKSTGAANAGDCDAANS